MRLLPMTNRQKDVENLLPYAVLQLTVLQRQLGNQRPQLRSEGRAFLAALLKPLPRATLRRLRLQISPDTVLRGPMLEGLPELDGGSHSNPVGDIPSRSSTTDPSGALSNLGLSH